MNLFLYVDIFIVRALLLILQLDLSASQSSFFLYLLLLLLLLASGSSADNGLSGTWICSGFLPPADFLLATVASCCSGAQAVSFSDCRNGFETREVI